MENNYQLSRIHNYVNGLMSRDEMHALEREALDDPFLQDAIDGYRMQNGVDVRQLSLLQQRLASRVEEGTALKNKRFFGWQRLAIGAAAAVMFITVCTLLLIRYMPQNRTSTLTEVEIMQDRVFSINLSNYDEERPPVGGWKWFDEKLNMRFSADLEQEMEANVEVIYVKEGIPLDVKIEMNKNGGFKEEELSTFLKGISWLPGRTVFTIKVTEVDMK